MGYRESFAYHYIKRGKLFLRHDKLVIKCLVAIRHNKIHKRTISLFSVSASEQYRWTFYFQYLALSENFYIISCNFTESEQTFSGT